MNYVKIHKKPRTEWRRWFAWYPVVISTVPNGNEVKAWLTLVWRKRYITNAETAQVWHWEYKTER
ncbi:hypothetical protein ACFL9T_09100 [Thermodesulfobacteriota bacterium]